MILSVEGMSIVAICFHISYCSGISIMYLTSPMLLQTSYNPPAHVKNDARGVPAPPNLTSSGR